MGALFSSEMFGSEMFGSEMWAAGVGAAWTPAALFADGGEGVWLDPSDLSTVFQDAAGTTAASVGDPVGLIEGASGNGYYASQSVAASRPTLRQDADGRYYLEFDGVDDFMDFGPIAAFSNSDFMFVAAVTPNNDSMVAEMRDNTATTDRVFWLRRFAANLEVLHADSTGAVVVSAPAPPAGTTIVATAAQSGLTLKSQVNQEVAAESPINNTVSATGRPHTLGCRTTNGGAEADFAQADVYGIIAVPRWNAAELEQIQQYLAYKAGVTL